MKFTAFRDGTLQSWKCQLGFWSFLILKDSPDPYFYCSYKNMNTFTPATAFNNQEEFSILDGMVIPQHFRFISLGDAQNACRKKYKQLLLQ